MVKSQPCILLVCKCTATAILPITKVTTNLLHIYNGHGQVEMALECTKNLY